MAESEPETQAAPRAAVWKNVVLSIASLCAAIAAIDLLAFFALDWKPPGWGQEKFFQYSFLTGFSHVPNLDLTYYRYEHGASHRVRTNAFGFADAERSLEKSRPRIALIGDSTTQGWEADLADRPQVVLEELLDGRYEVLNLGVRAFGTDQTWLLFEQVGAHFEPDILVYTFCVNDIADNARGVHKPHFELDASQPGGLRLEGFPAAAPTPEKPAYYYWLDLAKRSFVFRRIYQLAHQNYGPQAALEDHFELRPFKRHYDQGDKDRMAVTLALLGKLERFARERGMRFMVVEGVYRFAYDAEGQARVQEIYGDVFDFDRPSRELAGWSDAHGVPFLSLPRQWREDGVPIDSVMHWGDNLHLDGAGLRRYAQTLKERLLAEGWLAASGGGA